MVPTTVTLDLYDASGARAHRYEDLALDAEGRTALTLPGVTGRFRRL